MFSSFNKHGFIDFSSGLDPDSYNTPLEAFDFVVSTWEQSLKESETNPELLFNGRNSPNLADIVS